VKIELFVQQLIHTQWLMTDLLKMS